MNTRRAFLTGAAVTMASASVSRHSLAGLPEPVIQASPNTQDPLFPKSGRDYNPVVTLNGWTLPWRMNNGVKEFHLIAEPVVREMLQALRLTSGGITDSHLDPPSKSLKAIRYEFL